LKNASASSRPASNDCGTSKHSYVGQGITDGSPDEWVYVPIGTCEKIAGDTVVGKK